MDERGLVVFCLVSLSLVSFRESELGWGVEKKR